MNSQSLRQKYLDFFVSKGHKVIPSASLIPENDPTVLFTTAGMHPLVPYLMGEVHPEGSRLANAQKSLRTDDIDEVGDRWHLTFFEMLGNWSLNDYGRKEAIEWSFEFLTKILKIPADKLAVTVFAGDSDAPFDEEAYNIWLRLEIPKERIFKYGKKENWWGPAGVTGPCGPDTEMFYINNQEACGKKCEPSCGCGKYVEIWNDVFMEFYKNEKGKYAQSDRHNIDTGMGLERTLAVLNNFHDNFQADTLWPLIEKIEEISGHEYIENPLITKSMRVIADHARSAAMILGDDRKIAPGKKDQGYIIRRLIRRAARYGRNLGIKENFCSQVAEEVVKILADIYPEVNRNREFILNEISKEESKFRNTLERGINVFEEYTRGMKAKIIPGAYAFDLYQSYGFPVEMTVELAKEKGLAVDMVIFEAEMKQHQELSRAGAEQKFKGGMADQGEMSVKYHTATHLLHAALRKILGEHVVQRGSNITAERLRFDFSHPEKMTTEQKKQVEDLVNGAIAQDYLISFAEMSIAQAKSQGAMGLFENKYGNKVKVYSIGDPSALPGAHSNSQTFSREICGGPHAEHTGALGKFRIMKEEAVSAGVRRIKAVLEKTT